MTSPLSLLKGPKPMSNTYEPGETVYLESGQQAEYVAALDGGYQHVVRPMYDDDGGPSYGKVITVRALFDEGAVPAMHKEVQEVLEAASVAREELAKVQGALRDARREEEGLTKNLAKFEAFRLLDDFTAGRITHIVFLDESTPRIQELGAALKGDNRYDDRLRPISLGFTKDRSLGFKISTYYDGSGGWATCWPCRSLEEATEVRNARMLESLELAAAESRPWSLADRVKAAEAVGIAVPEPFKVAAKQYLIEAAQTAVTARTAELDKAKAALVEARRA